MENRNKITIEKKTSTIDYIEIDLPCYVRDGHHYYKVTSPDECVCVGDFEFSPKIEIQSATLAFYSVSEEGIEYISESKFLEVYNKVKARMDKTLQGDKAA